MMIIHLNLLNIKFNLGFIGYQQVRDNQKLIFIRLGEQFLQNHGLQYNPQYAELEANVNPVMSPLVKPNYAQMAKAANVEKQIFQNSLNNILQLIGELLSEGGNVEIDL